MKTLFIIAAVVVITGVGLMIASYVVEDYATKIKVLNVALWVTGSGVVAVFIQIYRLTKKIK